MNFIYSGEAVKVYIKDQNLHWQNNLQSVYKNIKCIDPMIVIHQHQELNHQENIPKINSEHQQQL